MEEAKKAGLLDLGMNGDEELKSSDPIIEKPKLLLNNSDLSHTNMTHSSDFISNKLPKEPLPFPESEAFTLHLESLFNGERQ